ncbi:glutaredoxin family protein [Actinomycetospora straminea]|uniref:glutaredoxin family protein n=1 Tax=Actinomycetospora straminea TaxID=663607 RepID=UPI003B680D2C
MADERSDERAMTSVGGATGGRSDGSTESGSPRVTGSDGLPDTLAGTSSEDPEESEEAVRVVVLVRADCRTCDRMEGVVREICGRVGEEHTVVDVDGPGADPEWRAEYGDRIPVVLVDDVEIASWRLEPDDLVRALGAR